MVWWIRRRSLSPRRILCGFLLGMLPVIASASEVLLINVDEAHPPFMSSRGGKAVGIYPAILEAAFRRMQTPLRLEPRPWARAIHEIDGAAAGLAGVYRNTERLLKWDYSEPLLVERIVVYHHRARPVAFATLKDLEGKRVGVMRGWSYGDAFDAARKAGLFQVEDVSSDEQNLLKLEAGRLDVVLAIPESVTTLLIRYRNIEPSQTPLTEAPAFLAFSKVSNRTALLERFNQALREMKADGELKRIIAAETVP